MIEAALWVLVGVLLAAMSPPVYRWATGLVAKAKAKADELDELDQLDRK